MVFTEGVKSLLERKEEHERILVSVNGNEDVMAWVMYETEQTYMSAHVHDYVTWHGPLTPKMFRAALAAVIRMNNPHRLRLLEKGAFLSKRFDMCAVLEPMRAQLATATWLLPAKFRSLLRLLPKEKALFLKAACTLLLPEQPFVYGVPTWFPPHEVVLSLLYEGHSVSGYGDRARTTMACIFARHLAMCCVLIRNNAGQSNETWTCHYSGELRSVHDTVWKAGLEGPDPGTRMVCASAYVRHVMTDSSEPLAKVCRKILMHHLNTIGTVLPVVPNLYEQRPQSRWTYPQSRAQRLLNSRNERVLAILSLVAQDELVAVLGQYREDDGWHSATGVSFTASYMSAIGGWPKSGIHRADIPNLFRVLGCLAYTYRRAFLAGVLARSPEAFRLAPTMRYEDVCVVGANSPLHPRRSNGIEPQWHMRRMLTFAFLRQLVIETQSRPMSKSRDSCIVLANGCLRLKYSDVLETDERDSVLKQCGDRGILISNHRAVFFSDGPASEWGWTAARSRAFIKYCRTATDSKNCRKYYVFDIPSFSNSAVVFNASAAVAHPLMRPFQQAQLAAVIVMEALPAGECITPDTVSVLAAISSSFFPSGKSTFLVYNALCKMGSCHNDVSCATCNGTVQGALTKPTLMLSTSAITGLCSNGSDEVLSKLKTRAEADEGVAAAKVRLNFQRAVLALSVPDMMIPFDVIDYVVWMGAVKECPPIAFAKKAGQVLKGVLNSSQSSDVVLRCIENAGSG